MTDEYDRSQDLMNKIPFKITMVELVEQDQIEKYPVGVAQVLTAAGHSEALVTDRSSWGDFAPDAAASRTLGTILGRIVHVNELIWELAKEVEEK
jgi:hypothetical protein